MRPRAGAETMRAVEAREPGPASPSRRITGIFNEIRYVRRYISHTLERNPRSSLPAADPARARARAPRYTRMLAQSKAIVPLQDSEE